jgi:VWFA-related protein
MNRYRSLKILLSLTVCASFLQFGLGVEAAGSTLAVHSTDATQFPKVDVTISLVDSLDIPLPGLDQSVVSLTEDNAPVSGVTIAPTVDPQQAYAVALLIEAGSTMSDNGKLDATKKAVDGFIDEMGPQDSVALLSFSDQVKVLQGYTSDKNALKLAVDQLSANGPSAVYDAINQASQFQAVISLKRKALLVLADGGDTASKLTLTGASSAARSAGVPVYAIGLGPDVHHDMLDQLAGNTSGQVNYVAGPGDLTPAFQGFGDRLRRLYIASYTSKIPGDDRSHNVSVAVKDQGQTLTGAGTFIAKSNAVSFQVTGLVNATRVSAITTVTANLTAGKATSMQLLVDDQSRQSIASAPYVFQWDTTKETPGIHRVVIRAVGADGTPNDREFVVEVLAPTAPTVPTPEAKPTPIAVPTAAAITPTAVPVAPPPPAETNTLPYIIGGVVLLALAGVILFWLFVLRRRKPAAKPLVPVPVVPIKVMDDRTEQMLRPNSAETQAIGETMDLRARPPSQPRARIRLVQQGKEQEIVLSQPETILGRDPTNPILVQDPMASRRHARIVFENGAYWVEDLKSLNGLRVNGEITTKHKLTTGDQIQIGEAVMTFTPDGK